MSHVEWVPRNEAARSKRGAKDRYSKSPLEKYVQADSGGRGRIQGIHGMVVMPLPFWRVSEKYYCCHRHCLRMTQTYR